MTLNLRFLSNRNLSVKNRRGCITESQKRGGMSSYKWNIRFYKYVRAHVCVREYTHIHILYCENIS